MLIHTRNVHAVSQAILFTYQSPQKNKDSLEGWELLWTSRTGNGQPWNMCKAHQTLRSMVEENHFPSPRGLMSAGWVHAVFPTVSVG